MKKRSMSLLALCLAVSMVFASTAFASEPTHEEPTYAKEMKEEEKEAEAEVKAEEAEEKAALDESEGKKVDAVWEEPVERPEAPTTVTEITDGTSKGDVNEAPAEAAVETPAEVVTETPVETTTEYTAEPVQESPVESAREADIGVEEEPVIIESGEITYDDEEWEIEAFEDLADVVTGIQDYEFAEDAGHKYDIHHGVTMNDQEVISSVLFDTSGVDFTTPGTYEITYYVYFHRVMIAGWLDLYDMDHADYPGVDSGADRIAVTVKATVTITEPQEDVAAAEGTDDAQAAETESDVAGTADTDVASAAEYEGASSSDGTASGSYTSSQLADSGYSQGSGTSNGSNGSGSNLGSVSGSNESNSSGSSGSGSSGSSGFGSTGSSSGASSESSGSGSSEAEHVHTWVEEYHPEQGHTESVLVSAAYDEQVVTGSLYICNNCGFSTYDVDEIIDHILCGGPDGGFCGGGSYHSEVQYGTVHHDAQYEEKYIVDVPAYKTYTCSGCGATK